MSDKNRLLILTGDTKPYVGLIGRLGFNDLEMVPCDNLEEAMSQVESCNIILGLPSLVQPILEKAKKLEWVQSIYAGVEVLVNSPKRTDYLLTGVKDVFGPYMSEYVFAYILALERDVFETFDHQKSKSWEILPYGSLKDRHIGICGLGSIGRHIAETANHFGMRVWGYKRSDDPVDLVERVFTRVHLNEFLAGPDYIVVTLPGTPETFHLLGYDAFRAMKDSAVLINVGRGSIVSEKDLVRALDEKLIGGAVLDVFEQEPLPEDSRLWELPNVLVTPHNSAFSFPEDIVNIFARNYRRFVEGKPLHYVVDFTRGY